MRTFSRPDLPPDLLRSIGLVCLADMVVGMAFGAITTGVGLPAWLPVVLSLTVFAGAAQFLFVGVVAAGGSPFAAAAAALLVNGRLLPLGLAVGDLLGPGWLRRLVGTHVVTDESVAFTTAQHDQWPGRSVWPSPGFSRGGGCRSCSSSSPRPR